MLVLLGTEACENMLYKLTVHKTVQEKISSACANREAGLCFDRQSLGIREKENGNSLKWQFDSY